MGNECLRFIPSRVEGVDDVQEVVVYPDRLELRTATGLRIFPFIQMVEWPRPAWLWRFLARIGVRSRWLMVGGRDFCHLPPDRYFAFNTEPKLVVRMPKDDSPDGFVETCFYQLQLVMK